ncbi:TPA: GHKL domain-containing protein [Enterococcus faecalis]
MELIVFVGMVYVNILIGINLLFQERSTYFFTIFYLLLAVCNLLMIKYTFFFLFLLYFSQCYYIYIKVENIYLSILLNNFLMSCGGLIIFLCIDLPRYLGFNHLYITVFLEIAMTVFLCLYLKHLDKKYHIFDYFTDYTKKMKSITLLSTLMMAGLYFLHAQVNLYSLDYVLTSIIMLGFNLFSSVAFIVFIINRKRKEFVTSYLKDLKETQEYYNKLDEFRHDYLNFIAALEYGISHQTPEEARELVTHFKEYSLERIEDARHNPTKKITDPVIKGLLYDFIDKAEKNNRSYSIQVLNVISTVAVDYIDLIRLLSIALNNAIEHYSATDNAQPIVICLNEKDQAFHFLVRNPAIIDHGGNLTVLLKRGHSEKKAGGLGLYNFSRIVNLYNNINYDLRYDKQEKLFELSLTISFN